MNTLLSKGSNSFGKIFKSKSFTQQFKKNLKNESYYDRVKNSWKGVTERLVKIDEPTKGNNVTVFFTGDQMFKSMWDCIENAKESISIETYTIEPDKIGNKTIDLLTRAQQRGVKVKFVYDAIGSSSLSDFDIYQMRVNNVEVYQFNPVSLLPRLPYTFRNHRKIMVVDGKYGFCGGMNISGKYASSNMEGGKDYFRDTHCMIEGPGAKQLLKIFHNSFKEKLLVKKSSRAHLGSPALFAASFPHYDQTSINTDGILNRYQIKKDDLELSQNIIQQQFQQAQQVQQSQQQASQQAAQSQQIKEEDEFDDETTFNDLTQTFQHINNNNINNNININNNVHNNNNKANAKISVVDSIGDNFDKMNTVQQNSKEEEEEDKTEFTIEDIEEYEGDEDEFKEFVSFTNDYHNLKSLNELNNYLIDDGNIPVETTTIKKKSFIKEEQEDEEDIIHAQQLISIDESNDDGVDYKIKSKTVVNTIVQVQESNLFRGKREIQRALFIALKGSRDHCYFTTPYFLPPRKLRKAIINAAKRGVDVRVITAGKSDVPWFRNASRHIYSTFLKHDKIKIYEMMNSTLHAKTLSIDGIYSTIGSYNLDTWSQRNLEANLAFFSPQVVNILEEQFKNDLRGCTEITMQDLKNRSLFDRLICYLSYQLSKLLKPYN